VDVVGRVEEKRTRKERVKGVVGGREVYLLLRVSDCWDRNFRVRI